MLHVHYLIIYYNPQMTHCLVPYATPVVLIWSANTHEEGTGMGFPDKAYYYPRDELFFDHLLALSYSACVLWGEQFALPE